MYLQKSLTFPSALDFSHAIQARRVSFPADVCANVPRMKFVLAFFASPALLFHPWISSRAGWSGMAEFGRNLLSSARSVSETAGEREAVSGFVFSPRQHVLSLPCSIHTMGRLRGFDGQFEEGCRPVRLCYCTLGETCFSLMWSLNYSPAYLGESKPVPRHCAAESRSITSVSIHESYEQHHATTTHPSSTPSSPGESIPVADVHNTVPYGHRSNCTAFLPQRTPGSVFRVFAFGHPRMPLAEKPRPVPSTRTPEGGGHNPHRTGAVSCDPR
ncbi:hypothetical protein K456DRAFT_45220 [Colletotrichum gloeosporioides 23]|nr:hypothetical protein K456DRAFT_45220 [Colletotrichum gloeosporioides 23]